MPRSIFISHVFEDGHHIATINKWNDAQLLGENFVIITEKGDFRQFGESAIKAHLADRIRGCACVMLLVGNDTHNHNWVAHELSVANSLHKPIIAVRIPGASGALPVNFRHLSLVDFDPFAIANLLRL